MPGISYRAGTLLERESYSTTWSATALPTLTAPFVTAVATPTTAEPAVTPTLTAVPATETAVEATDTTAQPLVIIEIATQVLPRKALIEYMKPESGIDRCMNLPPVTAVRHDAVNARSSTRHRSNSVCKTGSGRTTGLLHA